MAYKITMPILPAELSPPMEVKEFKSTLERMLQDDIQSICDHYRETLHLPPDVPNEAILEMIRKAGFKITDE